MLYQSLMAGAILFVLFTGPKTRAAESREAGTAKTANSPGIALNEILYNPPSGMSGDANNDGIRSYRDDEFIEIHNHGPDSVDIGNWTLNDLIGTRHRFLEGTTLGPGDYITVFGGGTPTGFSGHVFTASTGMLGLNNNGDLVSCITGTGDTVDAYDYSPGNIS